MTVRHKVCCRKTRLLCNGRDFKERLSHHSHATTKQMLYFDPSFFYTFLMNFMLAVGLVIEPLRLWLGFSGNLRERVPELTGCFLFSLFPQVIIAVYFLMLQPMAGYGFITALEVSLNSVLLIFLIAESVLGYLAAKRSVRMQTANFFLKMKASEEDDDELLKKGNVSHRSKVMDQRRNALSWSSLESFW